MPNNPRFHIDLPYLFESLDGYFTIMENQLVEEELRINRWYEDIRLTPQDELDRQSIDIDVKWGERTYLLEMIIRPTFRASFIVHLYSILEKELNSICKRVKNELGLKIGIDDLAGKGISRSRLFLAKVVGVDFANLNSHWQFLKNLAELRNFIVHADGTDRSKITKRFNQERDGVFFNDLSSLVIEKRYVESAIDVIKRFLVLLIIDIENLLKCS